ncbi:MAG: SufE family protein [Ignavibacteria bacterium]|jgi:cysteine desulfuration protein SufE|nr:SufE family protein [Ignavibacteria bacterium]
MEENSIEAAENEIVEEFSYFDDWEDKYEYLIEYGRNLSPLNPVYKTEDNKVNGCVSQVWLYTDFRDGKIFYEADSDAIITKGLVGLLVKVLSGRKPEEIVNAELNFIDKIGMKEHLSPTRSNGLVSMIRHMKTNAAKYV